MGILILPRLQLSGCLLCLLLFAVGCTTVPAIVGPPANPLDTLGTPGGILPVPRLRVQPLAQGNETPYTPIMLPPDVRRAFVRGHTNPHRDLIAGHWWYVRIQDWAWPVELEQIPPAGDAHILTPLAPRPPPSPEASSSRRSHLQAPRSMSRAVGSIPQQTLPGQTSGMAPPGVVQYTIPDALRRRIPNVPAHSSWLPPGSMPP
jgi:hypothetical protein